MRKLSSEDLNNVVLDTNVLVIASGEKSSPEIASEECLRALWLILELWRRCSRIYLSKKIYQEYCRNVFEKRRSTQLNVWFTGMLQKGKFKFREPDINPPRTLKVNEKDIEFIKVALASNSTIISNDSDLINAKNTLKEHHIYVITAEEACRLLESLED
jgi:predicted nucleic acid-binding protein